MILHTHSDSSYLSAPRSRSRAGGYMFLGNTNDYTTLNGPIHCEAKIIRNVVTSAAEAEINALFHNAKLILPLRLTLQELGHPQPPSPIQTDNNVADSFVHNTIKKRRLKTIAMNMHWLQDLQQQNLIQTYWRPKVLNLADYLTKYHSPTHHRTMRHTILHSPSLHT